MYYVETIQFYGHGHKYILGPTKTRFSPSCQARAKMRYCTLDLLILLSLWRTLKVKKKMTTKQSEEYFFHQCCKKMTTNIVMAPRFCLAAHTERLFVSHFSLVISAAA